MEPAVSARSVMADIKPQVYKDPRPAEYFAPLPRAVAHARPDWVYDVARILVTPPCLLFYRTRAIGAENVPTSGPVILAPNHFSHGTTSSPASTCAGRSSSWPSPSSSRNPVIRLHLPARRRLPGPPRPPRRGGVHDRPRDPRSRRLRADVRGGRALAHRGARRAEARASAGSRSSRACRWSRSRSTARSGVRRWRKLRFPKVTVQYGEPMSFDGRRASPSREQQLEVAEQIFDRVQDDVRGARREGPPGRDQGAARGHRRHHRAPGPGGPASLTRPPSAAHSYFASERRPVLGVVPGDDHRLRVLARGTARSSWQRAPPLVPVERARRLGRVLELAERVDGVARDHEVAVAQAADHALVAGGVPGRRGEPDAAVAEEVEGAAEGRVRVDARRPRS